MRSSLVNMLGPIPMATVLPALCASLVAAPSGWCGCWSHHHKCLHIFAGWVWITPSTSFRKQTCQHLRNVAHCAWGTHSHCQALFTATPFHPNANNYPRVGWLLKMLITPINLVPSTNGQSSMGAPICCYFGWSIFPPSSLCCLLKHDHRPTLSRDTNTNVWNKARLSM